MFNKIFNKKNKTKVLLTGLDGFELNEFPKNIAKDSIFSKNKNKEIIIDLSKETLGGTSLFNNHIKNNTLSFIDSDEIYVAAIQKIPYLVAFGRVLGKYINKDIFYIERQHSNNSWKAITDSKNDDIKLITTNDINTLKPSYHNCVGVVLGLSHKIDRKSLPKHIRNHSLFISPKDGCKLNLFQDKNNLSEEVTKVMDLIVKLNFMHDIKNIRLFIAAQPSFCLELGSRFQKDLNKNWIIHNYNGKKYDWAIEMHQNTLEISKR